VLSIPAAYFFFTDAFSLLFWISAIIPALVVSFIRSRIESKKTYEEELSPYVSKHGFTIVSSAPLKLFSTGPFPAVYVFSQPYVSTTTPVGSGEFVKYRRLTLRDASGSLRTTFALLEFKAFTCSKVLFKPELESLHPVL